MKKTMKPQRSKNAVKFTLWALFILAFGVAAGIFRAVAFTGPTVSAGSGAGALGTDAAGNVSIGTSTTNSVTKLLVAGSTTNSSAYGLQVWNSASGNLLSVRNDGAVVITGALAATVNASNISSGQFASGNFSFPSNLSVGTTTASNALTVQGNVFATGNITCGGTCGGSVSTSSATVAGYFPYWANATGGLAGTSTFYFSGGNVGVGTTTPASTLHIVGSFRVDSTSLGNGRSVFTSNNSVGELDLQSNTGVSTIQMLNNGTDQLRGVGNVDFAFYTNNTEKMRLTAGGNLAIGTSTATSTLTVAGEIKTTSGGVRFPDGTLQTTAASTTALHSQIFTSGGTWTWPSGVSTVLITICGGAGGGGGGGSAGNSGFGSGGGGGGGGGSCYMAYPVTVTSSISISIGAGGGGGAGSTSSTADGAGGVSGGNSSFGGFSVSGGAGGGGGGSNLAIGGGGGTPGGNPGVSGGNPGGGYDNGNGGGGGYGGYGGGAGGGGISGNGGGGISGAGGSGYGNGGGGGGGGSYFSSGAAGGNGTPGIVIVEWWQ